MAVDTTNERGRNALLHRAFAHSMVMVRDPILGGADFGAWCVRIMPNFAAGFAHAPRRVCVWGCS